MCLSIKLYCQVFHVRWGEFGDERISNYWNFERMAETNGWKMNTGWDKTRFTVLSM